MSAHHKHEPKVVSFTPTWEQQAAVDQFLGGDTLVIEAGAGTGKTSTLALLGDSTDQDGKYLAYNKAMATDAEQKFSTNVECRTAHSYAYRAIGWQYKERLNAERLPLKKVAGILGLEDRFQIYDKQFTGGTLARLTGEMVGNYCNSADLEVGLQHVPYVEALIQTDNQGVRHDYHDLLAKHLLPAAQAMWVDLQGQTGRMLFSHDHYLKLWQLSEPKINARFILFDEAQDANPVIADIVSKQDTQIVYVGDRAQAIYGWRGAIDAMSGFDSDSRLYLSQSFRFGPAIAERANALLEQLDTPLRLTGTESIKSVLRPAPDAGTVLCRGNMTALTEVIIAQRQGVDVHLVGGANDIRSFCKGAMQLKREGFTSHRDLMAFDTWQDVVEHAKTEKTELSGWVNILEKLGIQAVLDALDNTVSEKAAQRIITTAHKAKGREWPSVRLAQDFAPREDKDGRPIPMSAADTMLRYVAVTRAIEVLDATVLDQRVGVDDVPEV